MLSIQGPQAGDKVRIGKEPHIEEQIGLKRDAMLVAEAHQIDIQDVGPGVSAKAIHDQGFDLVDRVLRRVHHNVCEFANLTQALSLESNGLSQRPFAGQWMRSSSFAEPANQDIISSFKVENKHAKFVVPEVRQHCFKLSKTFARADVYYQ